MRVLGIIGILLFISCSSEKENDVEWRSGITLMPGESMEISISLAYNFKYECYESVPDSMGKWDEFVPQDDWIQKIYQDRIKLGDSPGTAALRALSAYIESQEHPNKKSI